MSSDESVGPLFFGPTSTGAAYRVPTAINSLLRPYQRDGAKFLFNGLFARHGALLCDEMGLGKTIQVIALLSALFHKTSSSESQGLLDDIYVNNAPSASTKSLSRRSKCDYPVLLLAPGSLLRQWAAELHAWGDYCSSKFLVAIAHGNTRASAIDDAEAGRVEIVITTYSTYQQQSELFDRVKWRLVVCDESAS
jgi:SNF2 family DNA or RNA helicase